jgi:DNA-directed RNA polymerase subunit RPC12/RpoP
VVTVRLNDRLRCPDCGSRFVAQWGSLTMTKDNIGTFEDLFSPEGSRTVPVLASAKWICDDCGWESDSDPRDSMVTR